MRGLDMMKAWLAKREVAFGEEAREVRLPFPRGVDSPQGRTKAGCISLRGSGTALGAGADRR